MFIAKSSAVLAIYLPAITNSEEQQLTERSPVFEGKGQLVLVVDDEISVQEITKSSLETYNYRVMLASDGVEAIALYAQHLDEISVVMLDMMMPNLDTPSVIRALKRINQAFLTKPFTMVEVLNTLTNFNQKI
jgi:two-component system, cell cycle sensor histidine kinase and response regulator CckA